MRTPPAAVLLALLSVAAPALLCRPAIAEPPRLSEPARWLRDYLRIDTTNPPGDEHRAAAYLAAALHREGIATRLLVSPGGRTSLYARLEAPTRREGDRSGKTPGALVLTHHIDVVPPGTGWTVEPFAGEIRDGVLYGRGALDIKSLGVAHLAAFLDLARGAREGRLTLTRDVVYLAVADEERGGVEGVAWIVERHRELLGEVAAVLGEGGANRTVNGRALWAGVEVAQKRPLWLRVTARGRSGHGSGLNPGSATHELVRALAAALDLPARWRVSEATRLYLGALAPLHNERLRKIFEAPDRYIEEDGPTTRLLPGLANLFLDTLQVTVLEGSDKINVVPAEASAQLDVRLLPETDAEEYLDRLREAMGDRVEVEVILTSPAAPPSPVGHPVYRAVAGVLEETAPVVPAFIPGFTDSRYFRDLGIPAYGVSPFFLEPQRFLGIHGVDESIPLDELDRGVERMKRIVRACATR